MDKDTKFALLVLGLPFVGLIYCGIIIFTLVNFAVTRQHPILTGLGFAIVPFTYAASIWIRASAKAYQQKEEQSVKVSQS
ncbi:MAG: hypothetical protein AB4058_11055 [Microcystaceae cyanobacterium]